ncbi:MAG: DUF4286 family protein [Bacteroidia bacterium]
MIIYNVTVNVEEGIHLEWLNWMKTIHIPEVMATGMFKDYRMLKLISKQEDELGETYAIQYYAENLDRFFQYQNEFAPALKQKTLELFGEKVLAFRTLMEEV